MRARVLLPLLLFGLIAVLAVLLPVAIGIAESRTQQLALQRADSMDQIVQRVQTARAQGTDDALDEYLDRFHRTYGESVLVVDDVGQVIAGAGDLDMDDEIAALVLAAARTVPQWSVATVQPWSPDTSLVAESFTATSDTTAGAVVLAIDLADAKGDVTRGWTTVAILGALILAALMTASLYWTHWVLTPVRALDTAVRALAAHREHEPARPTGPPELRRLNLAFQAMADGVESALEQQRGFVADASHQLRNPLAAIRLRIDSLPVDGGDGTELAAVERDLDRLENIVDRMLALAHAEHRATARAQGREAASADSIRRDCLISADILVEPHRDALRSAGIVVTADETPVRVPCSQADLEEIVEILLDNAAKYAGSGSEVWLSLSESAEQVVLEVADSGGGLDDADLATIGTRFWRSVAHGSAPGTGLGVAIVLQLAHANDARPILDRAPQGGLRVRLAWARP